MKSHVRVDLGDWSVEITESPTSESPVRSSELVGGVIALNPHQEAACKLWAADDRLWNTQETVEFNLRIFARVILKADSHNR